MMKTMYTTKMMSYGASAPHANAASCCAHTASMQFSNIALILDAMVMASIIVCALVVRLSALVVSLVLLALVLLVVLLVYKKSNMPSKRAFV